MRISDWSSDVCSSDLPRAGLRSRLVAGARPPWPVLQQARPAALCGARLQCRVDPRARPGVAPLRPRSLLRRDQELRPGGGRLRPGLAPRAGLRAPDRKSVVQAKSVSVRVDPGVRRNLNQQLIKTLYIDIHTQSI